MEPLRYLEKHFLSQCDQIQAWLEGQWRLTPPPVYGSVDLRNGGV